MRKLARGLDPKKEVSPAVGSASGHADASDPGPSRPNRSGEDPCVSSLTMNRAAVPETAPPAS